MLKIENKKINMTNSEKDFVIASYELQDFTDNLEAITEALEYENLLEYLEKRYPHKRLTLELFAEEAQIDMNKAMNIFRSLNDAPPKDGRYFISCEDAATMILYLNYLREK